MRVYASGLSEIILLSMVDWRGTPADSPVKDQPACGSCWVSLHLQGHFKPLHDLQGMSLVIRSCITHLHGPLLLCLPESRHNGGWVESMGLFSRQILDVI